MHGFQLSIPGLDMAEVERAEAVARADMGIRFTTAPAKRDDTPAPAPTRRTKGTRSLCGVNSRGNSEPTRGKYIAYFTRGALPGIRQRVVGFKSDGGGFN